MQSLSDLKRVFPFIPERVATGNYQALKYSRAYFVKRIRRSKTPGTRTAAIRASAQPSFVGSPAPQRAQRVLLCRASEFENTGVRAPSESSSNKGLWAAGIAALVLAAAAGTVLATGNWPALQEANASQYPTQKDPGTAEDKTSGSGKNGASLKEQERAAESALGRSGFLAAFALIFASEIGDRTFFIAGLLAAKVGKWVAFTGTCLALGLMTVISVGIGYAFKCVPDALKSSAPIGEYAGVALMIFFGARLLRDAWRMPSEEDGSNDEMMSAETSLKEYETKGRMQGRSLWQRLFEVGSLIFAAEWGDRSMFATIALGASQNPFGVAIGAFLGHAIATVIAVLGGAIAAKYISEKTISYIGGTLFIIFAVATAWQLGLGFA